MIHHFLATSLALAEKVFIGEKSPERSGERGSCQPGDGRSLRGERPTLNAEHPTSNDRYEKKGLLLMLMILLVLNSLCLRKNKAYLRSVEAIGIGYFSPMYWTTTDAASREI